MMVANRLRATGLRAAGFSVALLALRGLSACGQGDWDREPMAFDGDRAPTPQGEWEPVPALDPERLVQRARLAEAAQPPQRAASPPAVPQPAPQASPCAAPEGVSAAPRDIEELVALLDALPKPTSVACFLQSLERPLEVYLTRSEFSAQPAGGPGNPRTFLFWDALAVSIVPGGRSQALLEFGYRQNEERSIKGEIAFPLQGPITPDALVDRIEIGHGSVCGGCHTREAPASGPGAFEGALASSVIVPSPYYEVPLEELRAEARRCDPAQGDPVRCDILGGLLDHGEVVRTSRWASP